jgi:hypothetical protein
LSFEEEFDAALDGVNFPNGPLRAFPLTAAHFLEVVNDVTKLTRIARRLAAKRVYDPPTGDDYEVVYHKESGVIDCFATNQTNVTAPREGTLGDGDLA